MAIHVRRDSFQRHIIPDEGNCDTSYLEQPEFADRLAAYKRDEFSHVGVQAIVSVNIPVGSLTRLQNFHSAGIWGVEDDSGEAHFDEVYSEQCDELAGLLEAMGFVVKQGSLDASWTTFSELAEDGIYHHARESELVENHSELDNDYEYTWKGPGWYQINFDEDRVVFLGVQQPTPFDANDLNAVVKIVHRLNNLHDEAMGVEGSDEFKLVCDGHEGFGITLDGLEVFSSCNTPTTEEGMLQMVSEGIVNRCEHYGTICSVVAP